MHSDNEQIRNLESEISYLETINSELAKYAARHLKILELVEKNPILKTEWDCFMMMIRLVADPEDLKVLDK